VTFLDALGTLRRRWYIVIVGLAITAGLAVFASYRLDGGGLVSRFQPQYEASAVVNVVAKDPAAPTAADAPKVAYSLQAIMQSGSFGRRISSEVAGWGGGSIKASVPNQTSLVELIVAGPTPAGTDAAMRHILAELPATAASLMAPPSPAAQASPLSIEVAGTPTPPAEQHSTKGPLAMVLAALLGLTLTWWLALSVDRARAARRERGALEVHDLRDVAEPESTGSTRVPELAREGARG
jgi:hypothetical protein